jgi:hypothetical protein
VHVDYVAIANAVSGVKGIYGGTTTAELSTALNQARGFAGLSVVHVPVYFGAEDGGGLGSFGRWNVGPWVSEVEKLIADTEPYITNTFYEGEDLEVTIVVFLFSDRNLPYLIQEEINNNVYVCINFAHSFYELKVITSDDQSSYVLNCIFDALAENNVQKRYGSYKPEDFRITKDVFLKRYARRYEND